MVRKTAKYKVTLTDEERTELEVLISAGKSAARKLFRARILLKADAGPRSTGGLRIRAQRNGQPVHDV